MLGELLYEGKVDLQGHES